MNAPSDRLLKTFRLRSTPSRQEILHLFLNKDYALSHGDIEKEINNELDRVTVYRTLKTFLDKGLIHKVLDDEGSLKYALCNDACSKTGHHHDHVHFKCTSCGQTNCLEVEVPVVKLPKGYRASEVNLLIQGICERCSR
ncbi:Fur family transcriptional regulator [Ohtaekwangia kribbensis]|uniref:Fur family transcriptional regulator n=1 Tax=Ohtaekwangia kribbensis TaxID=688913 RepID=A0ABW3K9B5_9BACT